MKASLRNSGLIQSARFCGPRVTAGTNSFLWGCRGCLGIERVKEIGKSIHQTPSWRKEERSNLVRLAYAGLGLPRIQRLPSVIDSTVQHTNTLHNRTLCLFGVEGTVYKIGMKIILILIILK